MSKKIINFVAILSLVLAFAPQVGAVTIATGDLVKASTACKGFAVDAVYEVSGSELIVYPYLTVYLSRGYPSNFSTVKTVACSDLDNYTVKGYAKFRDGTAFRGTKMTVSGQYEARTVYMVENGKTRPIKSCSVYNALFNDTTCKAHTYWVPDVFVDTVKYTEGTMVEDTSVLPEGLFVKVASGEYGLVGAGNTVRKFSSDDAITANRYDKSKAVNTTTTLAAGTPVTGAESGLLAVGVQTIVTPTPGAAVTAALAADTPAGANVSKNTLYNPMLKIKLTGGATEAKFTGVTISKAGLMTNTDISGVSLWDEAGNRHGNIITSLTSDNKATILFPSDPITIPAGGVAYFTVKANFIGTAGTVYFSVAAVADLVLASGTVTGSFPLPGATMTLFDGSGTIADARMSARAIGGASAATCIDGTATSNTDIGGVQKEIAKFGFNQNNAKEDINVERVVAYVEGNIVETTDILNWKLYAPDNTVLASADKPVDRYVTFKLAVPYKVPKGVTRDLSVKADIINGSARYFIVHIQNDYDLIMRGVTTAVYVLPQNSTGGTFADLYDTTSGCWKLKSGSLTVTKNTGSPSGNISTGAENTVLAKFDLKASGEKLEVRKMYVKYTTSADGTATALNGNIVIRDTAGNVYASVSAATTDINTVTGYQVTLSSYLNLDPATTTTIEIVGNIPTSTYSATYKAWVKSFYVKRLSSIDYTTLSTTYTGGSALTVAAAALTGAKNFGVGNMTKAPGSNDVVIGSFLLAAGSAEDVKVNTITLAFTSSTASTDFNNLRLFDGATELGTAIGTISQTGNSYSPNLSITKSTTKTINVKANVLSSATGANQTKVTAASGVGASTGNSITGQYNAADIDTTNFIPLQAVTFSSGTATVAKDSDAPVSQIFTPSGDNYVEIHKLKISALNEALTLNKITFSATAAAAPALGAIKLYDGSTSLGEGSLLYNGTTYDVVFSGLTVAIPADGNKMLSLKAKVTGSGTMTPASVGRFTVKTVTNTDLELRGSSGLIAAGSITLTSNGASNYHMFHNTVPVITISTDVPGSSQKTKHAGSATEQVFKFTVNASGERDMRFGSIAVRAYTSGLDSNDAIDTFTLYDSTTAIAQNTSTTLNATTTSATLTFNTTNDLNSAFDNLSLTAGATKTFTLYANTSGMTVASTATATIYFKVYGAAGYSSGDSTQETDWANGEILYYYTPVAGSENSTAYSGANSYISNLDGGTLVY